MSALAERSKVNLDTLDKTYQERIMTLASIVFKKSTFQNFPIKMHWEANFDLDVNPQCYIPSPKVTDLLVLEKKIFKGFLQYMGIGATLVMGPGPFEQTFVPPS